MTSEVLQDPRTHPRGSGRVSPPGFGEVVVTIGRIVRTSAFTTTFQADVLARAEADITLGAGALTTDAIGVRYELAAHGASLRMGMTLDPIQCPWTCMQAYPYLGGMAIARRGCRWHSCDWATSSAQHELRIRWTQSPATLDVHGDAGCTRGLRGVEPQRGKQLRGSQTMALRTSSDDVCWRPVHDVTLGPNPRSKARSTRVHVIVSLP